MIFSINTCTSNSKDDFLFMVKHENNETLPSHGRRGFLTSPENSVRVILNSTKSECKRRNEVRDYKQVLS